MFVPRFSSLFRSIFPICPNGRKYAPKLDLSLMLVTHRPCAASDDEFCGKVREAVKGGTTIVQIRDGDEDIQDSIRTASKLKNLINVPLIINNRVDVALAAQASGVHLGQKDFPVDKARKILGPNAIIGWTVNTWDDVMSAQALDIDYLGVQIFPSLQTKPESEIYWGTGRLREIRKISRHRLVAIGGINLDNLHRICQELRLRDGHDGVAMAGKLWRSPTPRDEAEKAKKIIQEIRLKSLS